MSKRYLSFFVLTNDATRSRQYKIGVGRLKALLGLGAVFSLVLTFVVIDYVRLRGDVSELAGLRSENTQQRIELQSFTSKIRGMETQLAKLNTFDQKLRIIANIAEPKQNRSGVVMRGVGGGSTADADNLLMTPAGKVDQLVGQMRSEINALQAQADSQESSFTELQGQLMSQASLLASTPSVWPVRGWVTSTFGQRISPFTGLPHQHRGMDIANRYGTIVRAPADGIVVKVARERILGRTISIKHGYGTKTIYGHLSKTLVKVGQKVKRGQKIAAIGSTGRSTGPHLHYAVKVNGVMVNPSKYILN